MKKHKYAHGGFFKNFIVHLMRLFLKEFINVKTIDEDIFF
jgi:hypothetical protein